MIERLKPEGSESSVGGPDFLRAGRVAEQAAPLKAIRTEAERTPARK
jgi:hypothetical protein